MNNFIRGVLSFICGAAGVLILLVGFMGIGSASAYHTLSVLDHILAIIFTVSIAIALFLAASFLKKGKIFSIKKEIISIFLKGILIYLGIAIIMGLALFLAKFFIK